MTGDGYPANAMTLPAPRYRPPSVAAPPTVGVPPRAGVPPRVPPADPRVHPPLPGNGFPPAGDGFPPAGYGVPPSPYGRPPAAVSPLATLSVVFAFVFAPVGIVLGHVALSQIRYRGQAGRDRAMVGLTLSYIVSVVAVMALIVMAATASTGDTSPSTTATTTATTTTTTAPTTTETSPPTTTRPRQSPRTIPPAVPPPPATPGTLHVEDLQVGDCVEVQKMAPDSTRPGYDHIMIFRAACENRADVYRVDKIAASEDACPGTLLVSSSETVYACISKVSGT
jgi:hypothetical protein